MSGLSRTPGKRVYVNSVSRVRIPSSLPNSNIVKTDANDVLLISKIAFHVKQIILFHVNYPHKINDFSKYQLIQAALQTNHRLNQNLPH